MAEVQDQAFQGRVTRRSSKAQLAGKRTARDEPHYLRSRVKEAKRAAEEATWVEGYSDEKEAPPARKKAKSEKNTKLRNVGTGGCESETRDEGLLDNSDDEGAGRKPSRESEKLKGKTPNQKPEGVGGRGAGQPKGKNVDPMAKERAFTPHYGLPTAAARRTMSMQTPLAQLQLGRELGSGISGVVQEGRSQGRRVAVKMSDLCAGYGDVPILQHEVAVYEFLADLQGDVIPELVCSGWTFGGALFYLATELIEGAPLNNVSGSAVRFAELQEGAEVSLGRIHALGVAHGDIRAENLMVRRVKGKWRIVFLDFGFARVFASAAAKKADLRALKELFRSLRQGGATADV